MGFKYTDNLWCNSCYFKFSFLISISLFPNDLILIAEMLHNLMMRVHFVNKFIVVNENDSNLIFLLNSSPDLCLLIFILNVLNSIMQKYFNSRYDKSKILNLTSRCPYPS